MKNNVYSIVDLDGYAESMRDAVAKSVSENYADDLNNYISIEQVKGVIIGYSLGQDDEDNYLINEEVFNDSFEDIREWIINVGLAKLASNNELECAWDSDLNTMIFWSNNEESQQRNNKPSTENR